MQHPIFQEFTRIDAHLDTDFDINFMGSKVRKSFEERIDRLGIYGSGRSAILSADPALPSGTSEDYIEWVDLLEAIANADENFVMIEAGAGYGRWLVNAANAIRRFQKSKIKKYTLIGIEPDPVRFSYMKQHFIDNGIDPSEHALIQAGVSDEAKTLFLESKASQSWIYGEGLLHNVFEGFAEFEKSAQEIPSPELIAEDGRLLARGVPCIKLSSILKDYERVDILDCDLQEEELRVLRESIELVNARVKRVHIGTHSVAIEEGLRELFNRYAWKCVNDYSMGSTAPVKTPYGPVSFCDGIQSWINPRFSRENV